MTNIYEVNGRVLNHIAQEDIALTDGGRQLVNMFTHVLMSFYEYADNIPEPYATQIRAIAEKNEKFPMQVIKLVSPPPKKEFYDDEDECF